MAILDITRLYPSTRSSSFDDSDATYVMEFFSVSEGDIMPVTTPYILRKREEGIHTRETNETVYKTSKKQFLKKTSGHGLLVKKVKSSSRGYNFRMLSYKDKTLVLKSPTGKKFIRLVDIDYCKNHGSTLTIYTKYNEVTILVMRSLTDAYMFSNVLG